MRHGTSLESYLGKSLHALSGALACTCGLLFLLTGQIAQADGYTGLVNVTSKTSVSAGQYYLDRSTGRYCCTVTITNTSGTPIQTPLVLAFSNIPAGATLVSDGTLPDGTPYVDFTNNVPTPGLLAAGATTQSRIVAFQVSGRVRLSPTMTVWARPPITVTCSASPASGPIPLAVAFSATPSGSVVQYEWDFDGNGTYDWSSTTTGSTSHSYPSVGTFTAMVRVTDSFGFTATATVTIVAQPGLEARPSATPTSGFAPLLVYFTTNGYDPVGTIQIFRWDFDGNGTWDTYDTVARDYTHTYNASGTYHPVLYVQSSTGATATATLTIVVNNSPPKATADVVPSNGEVPLAVQLFGSATDADGSIVRYEWDFEGDGTYDWSSTTTGNTSHTYSTVGTYQAVFRATDNLGLTATATAITTVVSVGPKGSPTATAAASPMEGDAPLAVSFSGTATDPENNVVLYEWDFDGDGVYDWSSPTNGMASYTYTTPGMYYAAFRATDATGLTGVDTVGIKAGLQVSLEIADPDCTVNAAAGESIGIAAGLSAPVPARVEIRNQGGVAIRSIPVVAPSEVVVPLYDTMEGGTGGWVATGLWHLVQNGVSPYPNSHSPTHAWWYGQDATGNYATGYSANSGDLISSDIQLPADQVCELSFWSWEQTEGGTYYDRRTVLVSNNGGGSWMQVLQLTNNGSSWVSAKVKLSAYVGQTIRIRFRFDTLDSVANYYRGWYVDDVKISTSMSSNVVWDGKDDNGFIVNDGVYYAVLNYEFLGSWHELDLTASTGGTRYEFPFGSGLDQRDYFSDGFTFSPFQDQQMAMTFRLSKAQEVTAFIGPLWGGSDQDRIRTIVNRQAFPAGPGTIYWDGLTDQGEIAQAPPGDVLITGFWRYDLPDNAICVTGGTPGVTGVTAEENYFSPFSEKCDAQGRSEGITLTFTLSENVQSVELRVYSVTTSTLLRTVVVNNLEAGEHSIWWDGKNNNGEYVDIGDYRLGVIAKDAEGNESMLRYTLVRIDY